MKYSEFEKVMSPVRMNRYLAKVGINRKALKEAIDKGEKVSERYFLFEHGNELDPATVRWAKENKVIVVPSVNKFHYRNEDPITGGKRDIAMLIDLGVTEFQIESEYDEFFKFLQTQ